MKAYKVVRKLPDGKLVSATHNNTLISNNGICVTYIKNKYVKPILKDSLLFCFKDLNSAVEFVSNRLSYYDNRIYEVWEVDIKHPTTRGIFAYAWNVKQAWKTIRKLINSHKKTTSAVMSYGNPDTANTYKENTIWASEVKLTKLISVHQ